MILLTFHTKWKQNLAKLQQTTAETWHTAIYDKVHPSRCPFHQEWWLISIRDSIKLNSMYICCLSTGYEQITCVRTREHGWEVLGTKEQKPASWISWINTSVDFLIMPLSHRITVWFLRTQLTSFKALQVLPHIHASSITSWSEWLFLGKFPKFSPTDELDLEDKQS